MAEPVAPTGAMPMVPSLTPSASWRSPAELVAAEMLDLDLAAGALTDELHELALPFRVDALGLHRAHAKAQRRLLRSDCGCGRERGQHPQGQEYEAAIAALRCLSLLDHDAFSSS